MWRDKAGRFGAGAAPDAALAAGATMPGSAADGGTWLVDGKLEGKDVDKKSKNVSGIACTTMAGFPRACLIIDDNRQHAQFVTLEDGRLVAGESIRLINNSHKGEPIELDGEGVAFAKGAYYVIGSHGHPRDKDHELQPAEIRARIVANSQIVRLQRDAADSNWSVTSTGKLRDIILAEPTLRPFADRRLKNNGVTIEGIAIRGDRLLAGWRQERCAGRRAHARPLGTPPRSHHWRFLARPHYPPRNCGGGDGCASSDPHLSAMEIRDEPARCPEFRCLRRSKRGPGHLS